MPSLLNSTSSAARPARGRILSTRAKAARAAVALAVATVLAAACQPIPGPLPGVMTSHVVVPATGLPGGINLVLDPATFDAAAAAACASSPVPSAANFFGGDLGEWAVRSLAGENLSLEQQRARAGAALVSGYAAGQDLHQRFGVRATGSSPFGNLSPLVQSDTTIPALDQAVGQFLLIANSNSAGLVPAVASVAPMLVQLHAAILTDFATVGIPVELRPLLDSLSGASSAALAAAQAGAAGDVAAAKRAAASVSGILGWAGGYYLGITSTTPYPAPTLTC